MKVPSILYFGGVSNRSFLKPDRNSEVLEVTSDRELAIVKAIQLKLKEKYPSNKVYRKTPKEIVIEIEESTEQLTIQNLFNLNIYVADISVEPKHNWIKTTHPTGWSTTRSIYSIISMEKSRIRTLIPNCTVTIRQEGFQDAVYSTMKTTKAA